MATSLALMTPAQRQDAALRLYAAAVQLHRARLQHTAAPTGRPAQGGR